MFYNTNTRFVTSINLVIGMLIAGNLSAQTSWKKIGQLKTRSSKEIKCSSWSIGGETLDRDYTDYQSYKKYLGPLGAKYIRLQGGWVKCEKEKGKYSFEWLDAVVKDAFSQGVSPWIELSYGNPIYEGGGEPKLAGALPTSPEALIAWDNWVKATVSRYKNEVSTWEIWNEPDLAGDHKVSPQQYAQFYLRTAEVIKQIQPDAKLMAFGLALPHRRDFVEPLFKKLKEESKLHLVDILTYHSYNANPDNSYPDIERLRKLVWSYNPKVVFMQGESGAPSTPKPIGAMSEHAWSELTQAKWDLRRMLGDHGRGIATNLFTISDIHYASGDHMVGINTKGLLKTNPDKTIERPKLAYQAAQHVFSLFDCDMVALVDRKPQVSQEKVAAFGYAYKKKSKKLLTLWVSEAKPEELFTPKEIDVTIEGKFKRPVFVDLISGSVYEIPKQHYQKTGNQFTFKKVLVPDYPVVIAERSLVR